MNTIAIILTAVYLALVILLLIRLPWAMSKNIKTGIRFRQALSEKIDGLRLGRMLSRLGITNKGYLYEQRIHKIRHHIDQCEACENIDICDARADDMDEIDNDIATYCPNAEDLVSIRDEVKIDKIETALGNDS